MAGDFVIFDTDILIWVGRGNHKAASFIDKTGERFLSVQTYMELLQGAKNKADLQQIKDFLSLYDFTVLPFSEKPTFCPLLRRSSHPEIHKAR